MLISEEKLFDIDEFLVSILKKVDSRFAIRRVQIRLRNKYERQYIRTINTWFIFVRLQVLKGLSSFSKQRSPATLTSKLTNWKLIEEAGIRTVEPLTLDIMQESGEQAFRLGGIEGSFNVYNPRAVALAEKITATMVTRVTEQTQKGIAHIISTGIETGMTRIQIAKEIRPLIGLSERGVKATQNYRKFLEEKRPDLTTLAKKKRYDRYVNKLHRKRAELIAHTETARAQAEGTIEGYIEGGVKKVEFNAAVDACPQCAPLDGQIYTVHDAQGLIPVHPAGRCTWMVPVFEARRAKKPIVPIDDLSQAIKSINTLPGGGVSESYSVIFKDGSKAIYKPRESSITSWIEGRKHVRERASYLVGNKLGQVEIPKTILRKIPVAGRELRTGSLQKWVKDAYTEFEFSEKFGSKALAKLKESQIFKSSKGKMHLYDIIIGNMDRNKANFLIRKNGSVIPIDHGLSFVNDFIYFDKSAMIRSYGEAIHLLTVKEKELFLKSIQKIKGKKFIDDLAAVFEKKDTGVIVNYNKRITWLEDTLIRDIAQ